MDRTKINLIFLFRWLIQPFLYVLAIGLVAFFVLSSKPANAETVPAEQVAGYVATNSSTAASRSDVDLLTFNCSSIEECQSLAISYSCGINVPRDDFILTTGSGSPFGCQGRDYKSNGSPYQFINVTFYATPSTFDQCPSTHPYDLGDGNCSDLPTSCRDIDTMTAQCCEEYSADMCAMQGSEVASWERTGMGYSQCTFSCTETPDDELPEPPQTEEECEQMATMQCSGSGGSYNHFWDSEFDACYFSCNDAPEEPIDPDAPPTPDPADEPTCVVDPQTGRYMGDCVNDENPDNGECSAVDGLEQTFEGQCVAGDGVSSNTLAKIANQHLLGIKGKIQGTNERLDDLPENMAKQFGLGDADKAKTDLDSGFMQGFDRSASEVEATTSLMRGMFGLGDEKGLELVPTDEKDLTEEAGNYGGAISVSGSCPASESLTISGQSFDVSYDSACSFATGIRPFILAGAYILAGFIIFGGRGD